MSKQGGSASGLAMILTATVLWGLGYIVTRNATAVFSVYALMTLRYVFAFILLGLVCLKRLRRVTGRILREGALIGLCLFVSQFLQTSALGCADTTAGRVAFITALYVVLVPFLHFFVMKSRIEKAHVIAAVLAVPGLFLLTGAAAGGLGRGDLIALAGSLGFTVHILVVDRSTARDDVWLLTLFQFGFAAVYAGLAEAVSGAPVVLRQAPAAELVWPILYLGVFSTMFGFLLQLLGQARLSPEMSSVALSMEAAFGMLFSVALDGEKLTASGLAGCLLLFAAIVTAQAGPSLVKGTFSGGSRGCGEKGGTK